MSHRHHFERQHSERESSLSRRTGPGDSENETACANTLFEQPWWLQAAAPGRWGAVRVSEGADCVARLAYTVSRRGVFTTIGHPVLTPVLGPWLADGADAREVDRAGAIMRDLIDGLPSHDYALFRLPWRRPECLPFLRSGFRAHLAYTYYVPPGDPERTLSSFKSEVRRRIRRAEAALEVRVASDSSALVRLSDENFRRQGVPSQYDRATVDRLFAAARARDQGTLILAVDAAENVHAAAFEVWDERALYRLASARNRDVRDKGAQSLLRWVSIRRAHERGLVTDFAGSMLKGVEEFNRSFGARQAPILAVERTSDRRLLVEAVLRIKRTFRQVLA